MAEMLRQVLTVFAIALAGCSDFHDGSAEPASAAPSPVQSFAADRVAAETAPEEPLNTELVAQRGDVVAKINDWVLRYEGALSDGRLRFLESVSSSQAKDTVFDLTRSDSYPFGNYDIRIVWYRPSALAYRIEPAD